MRTLVLRLLAISAFALAGLGISTASAIDSGTPALTVTDVTVYNGPGTTYDVRGDIAGAARVTVDRCTYQWCQVHTGGVNGWVARDDLSFNSVARRLWTGPILNYPSGGPGSVCLYEGRGYTGDALCLRSGNASKDLLLQHLDNRYSSVEITGNVSVMLCRDRDFSSYCERVIESQPRLNGFLDNNVSSYVVY